VAKTPCQELPFREDDFAPVLDAFNELTAATTGWINLLPEVDPDVEVPPRSLLARVVSARGEVVPLATWLAPTTAGGRANVGIEHGSGPRALPRLAEHGLALPTGWLKVSDNSRRGLVLTTPGDAAADDVLWWLLSAGHLLSGPPLTGSWLAKVYRPR
jgi:hypothetical protein